LKRPDSALGFKMEALTALPSASGQLPWKSPLLPQWVNSKGGILDRRHPKIATLRRGAGIYSKLEGETAGELSLDFSHFS
jgi:hypothetical protein